jgi:primary-amine oxidase
MELPARPPEPVPSVEEFPVMTRETLGFRIRPDGFFNENPALDVPPGN